MVIKFINSKQSLERNIEFIRYFLDTVANTNRVLLNIMMV